MAVLREINANFDEGEITVLDDRGNNGDILIEWRPAEWYGGYEESWTVDELRVSENLSAPVRYYGNRHEPFKVLSEEVWTVTLSLIRIFK